MNMIFPFIAIFLTTYCTKRTPISNIKHVLSRVFNVIDDRRQQKKEKEANNTIKLNLCIV